MRFHANKPGEKMALHLTKGDILLGKKEVKEIVEVVIKKDQDRVIEATVRVSDDKGGKRIRVFDWRDSVPLYKKPEDKRLRMRMLNKLASWFGIKIKRV